MPPRKPCAFIIDSDDEHKLRLKELCISAGFEPQFFSDGVKLLKFLESQGLKISPSFYLIDVSSPKLSGFETCRRIRDRSHSSSAPILMMAAHCTPEDKLEATSAGALTCLPKPITLEELKHEIKIRKIRDKEMDQTLKERFKVTF